MTTSTHTEYGTWTDTFTSLHHAVTTGASAEEIRRLETVELDGHQQHGERS